jgi:hypothetical protein
MCVGAVGGGSRVGPVKDFEFLSKFKGSFKAAHTPDILRT